ncbi:alpha/beta hydrolase [Penicillium hispanicum]|uniref:alpha/beta hydrolase n=1 Tax=Penicillium hispanicum TaxID=1080232 RepID=UPI0025402FAE|nr:alpha/beta hydrolase [Penicillium hispanicum]KAJ5587790.1 alpha/beta hydrolase [Penicillium hispanicum]
MEPAIPLTETFRYTSATHSYAVRWTALGSSSSPPLIFIHGTPWSSRVWHTYAHSFAKYFHVYLFDNPGFGTSPLGQPLPSQAAHITPEAALDADLRQQTEVFAALYTHWAQSWPPHTHGQAHIIAHDHGGLMALRAHLLHGAAYASLCLINVVAAGPFGQPLFTLVAEHEAVFAALPGTVFAGVVEAYIRDAASTALPRARVEMLAAPWVGSDEGRRGFVRQMVQASRRSTEAVEPLYGRVGGAMPVRIVWGTEDRWIPVETAERLRRMLNARDVVLIEGAGHLVMYDQEGRLGVELGWWLREVCESG